MEATIIPHWTFRSEEEDDDIIAFVMLLVTASSKEGKEELRQMRDDLKNSDDLEGIMKLIADIDKRLE